MVLRAAVCVSPLVQAYDRITGSEFASRSEVIAQHGMAATSQLLASQIALDILKKGSNAVDAAIGGDLFAIIWDAKSQQLYGLNSSGRSPKSLSLEHLKSQGDKIPAHGVTAAAGD